MQNKKIKKKRSSLIVVLIIIVAIIGVIFYIRNNNKNVEIDGNSMIGTFLYNENKTKYTFNADGTGKMSSEEFSFDYKYKIDEDILSIDFTDKEVHDVKYSFQLSDGILNLIAKEGTVSIGEEYILEKVNK